MARGEVVYGDFNGTGAMATNAGRGAVAVFLAGIRLVNRAGLWENELDYAAGAERHCCDEQDEREPPHPPFIARLPQRSVRGLAGNPVFFVIAFARAAGVVFAASYVTSALLVG
jgi:hypothetical protein